MSGKRIYFIISAGMAAILILSPAAEAAKTRWVTFNSNVLNVQVSVPDDWMPAKSPKALAFHTDDLTGGTAGIGILKSTSNDKIEELADKEFEREGRPADWVRSNARLDGMRAIKIVGLVANNAERKMVQYFVETPKGNYLVQCQATADRWTTFGPIFATMLSKIKFLAP